MTSTWFPPAALLNVNKEERNVRKFTAANTGPNPSAGDLLALLDIPGLLSNKFVWHLRRRRVVAVLSIDRVLD